MEETGMQIGETGLVNVETGTENGGIGRKNSETETVSEGIDTNPGETGLTSGETGTKSGKTDLSNEVAGTSERQQAGNQTATARGRESESYRGTGEQPCATRGIARSAQLSIACLIAALHRPEGPTAFLCMYSVTYRADLSAWQGP